MPPATHKYRVGDPVTYIKPQAFERCGFVTDAWDDLNLYIISLGPIRLIVHAEDITPREPGKEPPCPST